MQVAGVVLYRMEVRLEMMGVSGICQGEVQLFERTGRQIDGNEILDHIKGRGAFTVCNHLRLYIT